MHMCLYIVVVVVVVTEARKRLEEEVGLPKGQAGTLAPPSPQDLDRKRPQQRAGFELFGFILSGLAVYRGSFSVFHS